MSAPADENPDLAPKHDFVATTVGSHESAKQAVAQETERSSFWDFTSRDLATKEVPGSSQFIIPASTTAKETSETSKDAQGGSANTLFYNSGNFQTRKSPKPACWGAI